MRKEGFETLEAADGETALAIMRREDVDTVLLDLRVPGLGGMQFLEQAKKADLHIPIIVVTGLGTVGSAVEAMKLGAFDYLTKPFDAEGLCSITRKAISAHRRQRGKPLSLAEKEWRPWDSMGVSLPMRAIASEIEMVAPTDYTVVITGETGTGKEVVARAIHGMSPRANGPFVAVDCGSIAPTLTESELFGHEKGAFTHAVGCRAGKFEAASGGTLFLDEISNLTLAVQSKLLRALQEKKIVRVGGNATVELDIRVIAATNRDLFSMVEQKRFRRDLYYRLNEFSIALPPLRERREDIIFLANRFLEQAKAELEKDVRGITEEGLELLLAHEWPGNVRELRNIVRRAALCCAGHITAQDLNMAAVPSSSAAARVWLGGEFKEQASLRQLVRHVTELVEKEIIAKALRETGGNKAQAARMLHVDYKTIHTKVKHYGLSA
jgi:two-component system nitrogen regulation response regulator GlnG